MIEGLIYAEKSFFDKNQSGELTSAIVNDTSVIREFLITTFPNESSIMKLATLP
ncbi:ABC transporter [Streptococcus pneumoniae]|nr:ABC transporter [Streptococcus pneumoniae]VOM18581.1 ABC transporter [Streptococcus pneumoniae]VPU88182.1 ABC transporter [Streptococcus pneumoniae]VSV81196.1 ABC transporter [Streptococcus pneumoniae]VTJ15741.1 ABC transporter [Streptococcus pneumoniae]